MILGRRDPHGLRQRVRGWLWPRAGWRRAAHYLRARVQRLPGTPHGIAAGVAAGVAVSFLPLLGSHLLLAFALAWLTRGSLLASALGTLVGNPWTFPLIFTATHRLGCLLLGLPPQGLRHLASFDLDTIYDKVELFLWPMLVGGLLLGAAAWLATYALLMPSITAVQERRRQALRGRPDAGAQAAAEASRPAR